MVNMADQALKKHKKRKSKASKPHTVTTQAEADALRYQLVGEAPVVKAKMPKLSGPFHAPEEDLHITGYHPTPGKNFVFSHPENFPTPVLISPHDFRVDKFSPHLHHSASITPSPPLSHNTQNIDSFLGNISHRKVHEMSDSGDDTPDLVPDDTEEGEVVDDESGYYGWHASNNQYQGQYVDDGYGGGTTLEYQFQGGFGRGGVRHSPVLQQEPSYLGVGENDFFDYSGSDQIEILHEGSFPSQEEDIDFDGVEEDQDCQPGGPSDLDLQLDEVGTIPLDKEVSGDSLPPISQRANISTQPPSYFAPPTTRLAPSSEQVKNLMKIAESHRPQGQQVELVTREPDISVNSFAAKSPVPDPQGSETKVKFSTPVTQQNLINSAPVVSQPVTMVTPPGVSIHSSQPKITTPYRPVAIPQISQVAMPQVSQVQGPVFHQAPVTNQVSVQAPPLAVPVPAGPTNVDPSTGITFHPMVKNYHIKVKEETAPPLEESLAFIVNDYFSRACTDTASLEIKEAYESLLRPANAQHLIKTELNPEFKTPKIGISKSGILKDGHARGVQNSIIRLAVALSQIANEIINPADPNLGPNGETILDRAMTGLKVAAYGSQRCNSFRRFLLRPHLNNCYQYVCSEPITQLSALLPPNLQDYIKVEKERTNRTIPLTKMGSRVLQNINRKKRGGGRKLEDNLDMLDNSNNSTSILGNSNKGLVSVQVILRTSQFLNITKFPNQHTIKSSG